MGDVAKDLAAGTVGGAAQLVTGHPFDTIKVKLQSQPVAVPGQPQRYAGAIDAVKKTIASEGAGGLYKGMGAPLATVAALNAVLFTVRGQFEALLRTQRLFKGLVPTMAREVPGNAAMFGIYELVKQSMAGGQDTSKLGRGSLMMAGGLAGASFWISVYPTDVVKSVIQVDDFRNPKYSGSMDAFRKILASEGVKGLYKGFGPAMARSIPANAACFLAFELTRSSLG
ncbi:Mitochondrial carnitine/acylcarnitine carrier-like protein [Linum perenne]